jgi:hypothetical protein
MKRWVAQPLFHIADINARLDCVEVRARPELAARSPAARAQELKENTQLHEQLRGLLKARPAARARCAVWLTAHAQSLCDLERFLSRIHAHALGRDK